MHDGGGDHHTLELGAPPPRLPDGGDVPHTAGKDLQVLIRSLPCEECGSAGTIAMV